jgi:hypothetical protein
MAISILSHTHTHTRDGVCVCVYVCVCVCKFESLNPVIEFFAMNPYIESLTSPYGFMVAMAGIAIALNQWRVSRSAASPSLTLEDGLAGHVGSIT